MYIYMYNIDIHIARDKTNNNQIYKPTLFYGEDGRSNGPTGDPLFQAAWEAAWKHLLFFTIWGWFESNLVGHIPSLLKNMTSSVGMMPFPIYGKIIQTFQSTNQMWLLGMAYSSWIWIYFDDFPRDLYPEKGILQLAMFDYQRVSQHLQHLFPWSWYQHQIPWWKQWCGVGAIGSIILNLLSGVFEMVNINYISSPSIPSDERGFLKVIAINNHQYHQS